MSSQSVAGDHIRIRWNNARNNGQETSSEARGGETSQDTQQKRRTYIEITLWTQWRATSVLWGDRMAAKAFQGEDSTDQSQCTVKVTADKYFRQSRIVYV